MNWDLKCLCLKEELNEMSVLGFWEFIQKQWNYFGEWNHTFFVCLFLLFFFDTLRPYLDYFDVVIWHKCTSPVVSIHHLWFVDMPGRFSAIFYEGDNFCELYLPAHYAPFRKGSVLKGKNLVSREVNIFDSYHCWNCIYSPWWKNMMIVKTTIFFFFFFLYLRFH